MGLSTSIERFMTQNGGILCEKSFALSSFLRSEGTLFRRCLLHLEETDTFRQLEAVVRCESCKRVWVEEGVEWTRL
jgi:hypothetical protein